MNRTKPYRGEENESIHNRARDAALLAEKVSAAVDWHGIQNQAILDMQAYLRIPTINPPGQVVDGANWLAGRFNAVGIPAVVEEIAPGHFGVVGRIAGTGKKPPILLVHHIDTVPVEESQWTYPPFSGERVADEIWGRGALDDKGPTIITLAALIGLQNARIQFDRDVIFVAAPDEETGGEQGVKLLLEKHADLCEAALALVMDGAFITTNQGILLMPVATAEKSSVAARITLNGQGGHAAMPFAGQPLQKLTSAMQRLTRARQPIQLTHEMTESFRRMGAVMGGVKGWLLRHLSSLWVQRFVLPVMAKDPAINALLHNTVAWTGLTAGIKYNAIPGHAEALVNMRIMPGQTAEAAANWMKATLRLPEAEVEIFEAQNPSRSEYKTPLFAQIEAVAARRFPRATVIPILSPNASDARHLRPAGILTYGIVPGYIPPELMTTIHSHNERIPIQCLLEGPQFMFELLVAIGHQLAEGDMI